MWTLTNRKTGEIYYLLPDKEKHTVGRQGADLILASDTSISRSHACLYISKDVVKVIDVGSKYGTFCNDNIETKTPMSKNIPIELNHGERVKFGMLENEWILSKLNICTLTSTLTADHKTELQNLLKSLGGRIIDKWEKSCSHLTMSEIAITHKLLQALVENRPIVSVKFWRDYVKNLKSGQAPPSPVNYLPSCAESFINRDNVSFAPVAGRRTIFAGLNFVFLSSLPFEKYKPIIESAGGTCGNLYKGVSKSSLTKKNVIVIRAKVLSQPQSSQTVESIHDFIRSKGRRVVPDAEIGLAILHCSTAKYCNPDYNIVNDFAPESNDIVPNINIIAKRTPSIKTENMEDCAIIEIPESIVFEATEAELNVDIDDPRKYSDVVDFTEKFPGPETTIKSTKQSKTETSLAAKRKRNSSPDNAQASKKLNTDNTKIKDRQTNSVPMSTGLTQNLFMESSSQPPKPPENLGKHSTPSTSTGKTKKFTIDLSLFMDTSQIVKTQMPEPDHSVGQENNREGRKRARIAAICSDDDDDDLFAFDSSSVPKKNKGNKDNIFAPRSSQRTASRAKTTNLNENSENKANQQQQSKETFRPRDKIPFKIPTEGWLSKEMIRIKIEENAGAENSVKEESLESTNWINSLKGGFEVRVRPLLVVPSHALQNISNSTTSSDTTDSTNTRNFKKFVKKMNYTPQTTVIKTVPVYVGLGTHSGI